MVDYIKLFDKIIEFINWDTLKHTAFKLNTDNKVSKFFTKDHLKSMNYHHISQKDSLRDLSFGISISTKLKETVASVSLSTLSYHNNKRNYEVFLTVLNELINKVLNTGPVNESLKRFGSIKLIDSTTISMSLNLYQWALFRSTKSGIKIHTRFDLNKGVPDAFVVTNAVEHDKTAMDSLIDSKHCIYVFDKGYLDYEKFDQYAEDEKYFVTRLKHNAVVIEVKDLKISHSYERLLDVGTRIICDKIVKLGSKYTYQTKQEYRLIKIIDKTSKELTFVTNIDDLFSEEIAFLYKKRWEIELFFKWIKQNLKFKTFVGRSLNAVMIQIITGIMTFAILKLIEPLVETKIALIQIKRAVKANLFEIYEPDQFNWSYIFNSS
ncbi:IS4 family transposase [Clostridium beijerinckii]|uniref:IS4 family transposase n=1 Tax=Clostridium beijerinckii TaxID=1520 RepID=UPI0022268F73|nr:IS4 family transposase [Clostridium beijerinckii]UYZ34252.1 IS4 family transposase [Clostridium beijerinckii]